MGCVVELFDPPRVILEIVNKRADTTISRWSESEPLLQLQPKASADQNQNHTAMGHDGNIMAKLPGDLIKHGPGTSPHIGPGLAPGIWQIRFMLLSMVSLLSVVRR